MTGIDTSIYQNEPSPLNMAVQASEVGSMQQNMLLRGVQLHAQESIGNALMHNTGPDGTVNTDGFQAELAGVGNPYAQQQGAELAQHLNIQQSLAKQQQIAAKQSAFTQAGNEFQSLGSSTDPLTDDVIAGWGTDHYGQAMQGDDLGGIRTKSNVLTITKHLSNMPVEQRAPYANQVAKKFYTAAGRYDLLTPYIPSVGPGGQPGLQSPLDVVQSSGGGSPAPTQTPSQQPPQPGNMDATQAGDTLPPVPAFGGNANVPATITKAATPTLSNTPAKAPTSGISNLPMPGGSPQGFHATAPSPQQAAGLKQMQDRVSAVNDQSQAAQQNLTALDSAKQLISNPQGQVSGPVRQGLLNLQHTNPALADLLSSPQNLSNAELLQKYLGNALPPGASDADRALIQAARPNVGMLQNALMKAIDYQRGMSMIPIEQQRVYSNAQAKGADLVQVDNQWTQNADPKVFEYYALPQDQRSDFAAKLTPSERKAIAAKGRNLMSLGAFPNGQ